MKYTKTQRQQAIKTLSARSRKTEDGCFEWTGPKTPSGYGNAYWNGRSWFTHRLAAVLFLGPVPAGKEVHHKCYNPACFNPEHLAYVTHSENTVLRRVHRSTDWGVYLTGTTYRVIVRKDGALHYGGRFKTKEEALIERDKFERALFGYNRVSGEAA